MRVGIIEFSNFTNDTAYGNNVINLYDFQAATPLQRRIEALGHSGGHTQMASAFRFARDSYFKHPGNLREGANHIFIYIGDGFYTDDSPDDEIEVTLWNSLYLACTCGMVFDDAQSA